MGAFGERLKEARLKKGLKQSEVAETLDFATSSMTNWESGKIQPSMEVLARVCEVLEVCPLDLLEKQYAYTDIVEIAHKPAYERTYEESVALNFSGSILDRLMPAAMQHAESLVNEETARFIRDNQLMDRFSGLLSDDEIELLMKEYKGIDKDYDINSDLLFAFHALTYPKRWVLIEVLQGLMLQDINIQPLVRNMTRAIKYTFNKIATYPGGMDYFIGHDVR